MSRKLLLSSLLLALTSIAHAGSSIDGKSIQPAPTYGTGFYIGLQGGFNAFQNTPADHTNRVSYKFFGDKYSFSDSYSVDSKLGGYGGLKLGYAFNTGIISPAIEVDGFYNGFTQTLKDQ